MYVCYMHAHVSPYAHVDEGLHVDSAYTNATYVAGAACMKHACVLIQASTTENTTEN